jgi:hypothetical protein
MKTLQLPRHGPLHKPSNAFVMLSKTKGLLLRDLQRLRQTYE